MSDIAEPIRDLAVPLAGLQHHPRNPRVGDVDAIAESLRRFGQVKPVVVQESTGYIVAGNHIAKAAKSLGWTEVAATFADMDDDTALAYLLADNRMSDLGTYDRDVLAALAQQARVEDNLAGTGYSPDDVDALVGALVREDVDRWAAEPSWTTTLSFESDGAFQRWLRFQRRLNETMEGDTFGARLSAYIEMVKAEGAE
jgi:hypothetical protein